MRNLKDSAETTPSLTPEDIDRLEQRARSTANGYAYDTNISCYVYGQDVLALVREVRRLREENARLIDPKDTTEGFWESQKQAAVKSAKGLTPEPEIEPDPPIAPMNPEPIVATVPTPVPVTLPTPTPPVPAPQPSHQAPARPQQRNERGGGRR